MPVPASVPAGGPPGRRRLMESSAPEHPPTEWPAGPPPDRAEPGELSGRAERKATPGPLLVVLVLGAALALAVAAVWAFGVRSTTEGPYRRLAATEFEARINRCSVDPDGRPVAAGSITNRSGDGQTLVVEVDVLDPDGTVIDTPRATLVSLDDGAGTTWQTRSPYELGRLTPITCRIGNVFAAPGG